MLKQKQKSLQFALKFLGSIDHTSVLPKSKLRMSFSPPSLSDITVCYSSEGRPTVSLWTSLTDIRILGWIRLEYFLLNHPSPFVQGFLCVFAAE